MIVPVRNLVETVDLTTDDIFLPLLECVVNSIISLQQSPLPEEDKKIQIKLYRGDPPQLLNFDGINTISSFKVIDNGIGFNTKNYKSFETPFSQINGEFGCKGIGRFTVLAAFDEYVVESTFKEGEKWLKRKFRFTTEKEIELIDSSESEEERWRTVVDVKHCNNELVAEKSAVSIREIAELIMQHCFIYYLNGSLPKIEIFDDQDNCVEVINELFEKVSKEKERDFKVDTSIFRLYITKTIKEGNRKNNYVHYCANNRAVGSPKNLKNVNNLFSFPIVVENQLYYFDVYVVSDYLNKKVYKTRNGFNIPKERDNVLFPSFSTITFQDIEEKISQLLESEYEGFVKKAKEQAYNQISSYITAKAPRYNSFLRNPSLIQGIPPNLPEEKLEEQLYSISFNARKKVEKNIQKFIDTKSVNEEAISKIINDIKEKTAYDVDSLADYMTRRKAILELFDKFLDADENGHYKLEEDVHNLIFPLGLTNKEVDYENHNLWLLDERFITYKFIASDKPITSYSQKNSRKELDLVLLENPDMFDNPISFGDKSSGEVNSMVIFEFKRPGDTAHQKSKSNFRWEFSELITPYFDEFLYQPDKKNYKGNQVVVHKTTPKFGFVILDVIPPLLEDFNRDRGWQKTPFGTFFKIEPAINLHIEVMTFRKLLDFSVNRHNPFFDKLFTKS